MTITAARPGWDAIFWARFDDREEYTTEPVVGWFLKHNDEIEPVSMAVTGKFSLPTPTLAGRRRSSAASSERYLGCLEHDAPWPFGAHDPRKTDPDEHGVRRVIVKRQAGPGADSFELAE